MLKKLVKYGNSNAIILDKAILELLGIAEGSTIKIRTDGKSIIITPQEKAPEVIQETFTAEQAQMKAVIQERLKKCTVADTQERTRLEKKLFDLHKKYSEIARHVNPETYAILRKEIEELAQKMDTKPFEHKSVEYINALKELRKKHTQELVTLEEEIANFETTHNLIPQEEQESLALSKEQENAMYQEFAALSEQYEQKMAFKNRMEHLNNPEYQHEAQLIAERYNFDKNSTDYLNDMNVLLQKYNPELYQQIQEIQKISQKYRTMTEKSDK